MKVSVCLITYNQKDFISQAIEGVLMQKTTFPFDLVIGDDNSTDGTSEICSGYAAKFPDIVKYHRHEKNLGMMPNFLETLKVCSKSEYIALCEGDDYWVDENKLQLQADFLDANIGFSFSGHNHFFLRNDKLTAANKRVKGEVRFLKTEDYMLDPLFQTASYFFRSSALPAAFPAWYNNVLAGDHFLVLLLSLKGDIVFFNRKMSVFRTFDNSLTIRKGPLEIKQNFVHHLKLFNEDTGLRFDKTINKIIRRWNLVYKVYEPAGYLENLAYLARNFGFYLMNFRRVTGFKLMAKYLLTSSIFNRVKSRIR